MKIKKITQEDFDRMELDNRRRLSDPVIQIVGEHDDLIRLSTSKLNQIIDWINKQEEKE